MQDFAASQSPCKIILAAAVKVDPGSKLPAKTKGRSAAYEWLALWPCVTRFGCWRGVTSLPVRFLQSFVLCKRAGFLSVATVCAQIVSFLLLFPMSTLSPGRAKGYDLHAVDVPSMNDSGTPILLTPHASGCVGGTCMLCLHALGYAALCATAIKKL